MRPSRFATAAAVLVGALAVGCGGGGGEGGPADTTPPINYAGTYTCAAFENLTFTAVLTTVAGNFSSCSGSVTPHPGDTRTITCQGSINSDGAFNVSGIDSTGVGVTFVGTATATTAAGIAVIPIGAPSGTFQCQH